VVTGIVITIRSQFRHPLWLGWTITVVSCGLFTTLSPEITTAIRTVYLSLIGLGLGILYPTLQVCAQAAQEDGDVGIATSTFSFIRSLGQAFGVGLGGLLFQNQWDIKLAQLVATGSIPPYLQVPGNQAEGLVTQIPSLWPNVRQVVTGLYSDSLRAVWISFVPLAAVGLVASLFAKNYSLNRKLSSRQSFDDARTKVTESNV
jgi:hypothetical protein